MGGGALGFPSHLLDVLGEIAAAQQLEHPTPYSAALQSNPTPETPHQEEA